MGDTLSRRSSKDEMREMMQEWIVCDRLGGDQQRVGSMMEKVSKLRGLATHDINVDLTCLMSLLDSRKEWCQPIGFVHQLLLVQIRDISLTSRRRLRRGYERQCDSRIKVHAVRGDPTIEICLDQAVIPLVLIFALIAKKGGLTKVDVPVNTGPARSDGDILRPRDGGVDIRSGYRTRRRLSSAGGSTRHAKYIRVDVRSFQVGGIGRSG